MSEVSRSFLKPVLEPRERISELLFGLIMVLTLTCFLSVATAGREEVRTVLLSALGCNLAWGVSLMGCSISWPVSVSVAEAFWRCEPYAKLLNLAKHTSLHLMKGYAYLGLRNGVAASTELEHYLRSDPSGFAVSQSKASPRRITRLFLR